jgi:hypothetical protein
LRRQNKMWAQEDWDVVAETLRSDMTTTQIYKADLLPGRSVIDIQNARGRLRTAWRNQCPKCRDVHLEPPSNLNSPETRCCDKCKAEMRAVRDNAIAGGECAGCHRPRDDEGSATLCSVCLNLRREGHKGKRYRSKKPKPKGDIQISMFNWPRAFSMKVLGVACAGRRVVDLFGGSGKGSVHCHQNGATIVGWNDIHPMLHRMMEAVVREPEVVFQDVVALWHQLKYPDYDIARLQARYQEAAQDENDSLAPALMHWMARHTKSGKLFRSAYKLAKPKHLLAFLETAQALEGAQLTQMDFETAIHHYDAPGVTFLVDPPWPNDKVFEYQIEGRHADLFRLLFEAQADFVVAIQSSGATVTALQEGGFHDPPRRLHSYRRWCAHAMEVLISSFELDGPGIKPFQIPRS